MNSFLDKFRNPELCREVLDRIKAEADSEFRFMEVCGTHTVAIFRSGIHSLLPESFHHISGPGCPVCVTHESEVAAFLEAAKKRDVIIATFGDLMRVPGPKGMTLKAAQAEGARIKVVYSPFDALKIAEDNPGDKVVFLGVGFETTAPTVAATVRIASERNLANFFVLSFHKLVPPAMEALLSDTELKVDGFILPGHVSAIIGLEPYEFIASKCNLSAVVAGFEPLDILQALLIMLKLRKSGQARVVNNYTRAVPQEGNKKALSAMYDVFRPADALWRGIGCIPGSGLVFGEKFARFDALNVLDLDIPDVPPIKGCLCGEVLKGKIRPDECPLFRKICNPAHPVGPCMVSTEGSCAAYYKYRT